MTEEPYESILIDLIRFQIKSKPIRYTKQFLKFSNNSHRSNSVSKV
jgi:hypothetical protein